jgi:cholesterol transport system auxiliary component
MIRNTRRRALGCASAMGLSLFGGCGTSLLPKPAPPPALFALDAAPPAAAEAPRPAASAPTLIVNAPRAAAGFETAHIIYLRRPHEIEYYAYSQWVDTPAQMFAPLIVSAIERTGAFRAVLRAPTAAAAELRLDTELIRLQQDFGTSPSRVQLTLRAVLIETATRRVVGVREFDASVPAPSDDTQGGVAAANLAARRVLDDLAAFVAEFAKR